MFDVLGGCLLIFNLCDCHNWLHEDEHMHRGYVMGRDRPGSTRADSIVTSGIHKVFHVLYLPNRASLRVYKQS